MEKKFSLWLTLISFGILGVNTIISTIISITVTKQVENKYTYLDRRWHDKHEVCYAALNIIDQHFNNQCALGNFKRMEKDDFKFKPINIEEARQVMNQLAVTCENPEIINLYLDILSNGAVYKGYITMDKINDFRNLVRTELKFGKPIKLNSEIAWIGVLSESVKSGK